MKFPSFRLLHFFVHTEILLTVFVSLCISNVIFCGETENDRPTNSLSEKTGDDSISAISRKTHKVTYTWVLHDFKPRERYFELESPVFGDEENKYLWRLTCRCGSHIAMELTQVTKYDLISEIAFEFKNSKDEMLRDKLYLNHRFTEESPTFLKQTILWLRELFPKLNDGILKISVTITLFVESGYASEKTVDDSILAVPRKPYKFAYTWILEDFKDRKGYFELGSPVFGDEENKYLWRLTCQCGSHIAMKLTQVTKYNLLSEILFEFKNSEDEMLRDKLYANYQFTEKSPTFLKQTILWLKSLFPKLNDGILKISVTITLFIENEYAPVKAVDDSILTVPRKTYKFTKTADETMLAVPRKTNKFTKTADDTILAVPRSTHEFTYTWILSDFKPRQRYFELESPVFGDEENKYLWRLTCKSGSHIGMEVTQVTNYDLISEIMFEFKNSKDEMLRDKLYINHHFTEKSTTVLKQSILWLEELYPKLNDGILKISVTITLFLENEHLSEKTLDDCALDSREIKLLEDFKVELKDKILTDVVLETDNFTIAVHKFVLAARSSVFRQIFANDTLKSKESIVPISDMDEKTLGLMVEYMYSGHVNKNLSNDGVKKLLRVADKYNLTDLKEICENRLSDNLVLSTVVNNLLLADSNNADDLKTAAIDLIVENRQMFVDTTKLEIVAEKAPKLLLEILSQFVKMLP